MARYVEEASDDYDLVRGLLEAARVGDIAIVEDFIADNANSINVALVRNRQTPLQIAAINGHMNIVRLLLQWCPADGIFRGERVIIDAQDDDGNICLHSAAQYGHYEIMHELLSFCMQQDPPLNTEPVNNMRAIPLHMAALHGRAIIVEMLLKRASASANKSTYGGHTPLHYAVFSASPETVMTMLQISEGLKVRDADWKGISALEYAKDMCVNIWNERTPEERRLVIGRRHSRRIVHYLERFDVHGMRNARQAYTEAANAILVAAVLIASLSFSSWLGPPSGFGRHGEEYVAINKYVVGAFWVFSCISFFCAIASIVAGAHAALPKRLLSLKKTVVQLRRAVLHASWLLVCAVTAMIGAFVCAGIGGLEVSQFPYVVIPISVGGVFCVIFLSFYLRSMLGWTLD